MKFSFVARRVASRCPQVFTLAGDRAVSDDWLEENWAVSGDWL